MRYENFSEFASQTWQHVYPLLYTLPNAIGMESSKNTPVGNVTDAPLYEEFEYTLSTIDVVNSICPWYL